MLVLLRGNYEPFQRGRQGGGGQAGHELVSEGSAPWGTGGQCKGQLRVDTMKVEMHGAGCPADLSGSPGYARTAPTAQADLDLRKNGASIGTVTFAVAASTATFAFTSKVAFAAGDRLTVLAPGSQDASLADILITFKGTGKLTMARGSKITATRLTSINAEQVFDQAPTLNPREIAHSDALVARILGPERRSPLAKPISPGHSWV